MNGNSDTIVIFGAEGHAKEIYEWMGQQKSNYKYERSRVVFFDNIDLEKNSLYNRDVIHTLNNNYSNCKYILGVGSPKAKKILNKLALSYCMVPQSVVHQTALIGSSSTIGIGVILCPNTIVTVDCKIGNFVCINWGATVGHDTIIGDFTTILPGANVSGNCTIGEGCYIGANSVIREKIKIGDNSTVGAGAVVVKDVPANTTVVGNPAKEIIKK